MCFAIQFDQSCQKLTTGSTPVGHQWLATSGFLGQNASAPAVASNQWAAGSATNGPHAACYLGYRPVFVLLVVRGVSPGCRLFGTAYPVFVTRMGSFIQ